MSLNFLWINLLAITPQQIVMYVVGAVLIWLAIEKGFEPALLMPMGFGAILVNLPLSGVMNQFSEGVGETHGIIQWLFEVGIEASEAMPILLFIGIGAMIDFGPLLSNPKLFLCGAAAQGGIFLTIMIAAALGFDLKDAASIGIIGAADGPTSILVSQTLGSNYIGAIAVAAYSYMALVPIIQPFAIKLVTTKKDRAMRMPYRAQGVSKRLRIMFPIVVSVIAGLVAPSSVALVGFLMFGNLIRECGVLSSLSQTAQNELANLITLLLGITIAASMKADQFVRWETLMIMGLGLVAFILVPLMGSMGAPPATRYHWATGYDLTFGIALGLLCAACCLAGLFCTKHPLWATWAGYRRLLQDSGRAPSDFLRMFGAGPVLLNTGINGLISMAFILCSGGDLNGPTVGGILTIMGFSAFGKHAFNIIPVMAGVFLGGLVMHWSLSDSAIQLACSAPLWPPSRAISAGPSACWPGFSTPPWCCTPAPRGPA